MAAEQTKGYVKDADDRIDWVLSQPYISNWLKQALRSARERDPVELLNDLEMLDHLLRRRAETQVRLSLSVRNSNSDIEKNSKPGRTD